MLWLAGFVRSAQNQQISLDLKGMRVVLISTSNTLPQSEESFVPKCPVIPLIPLSLDIFTANKDTIGHPRGPVASLRGEKAVWLCVPSQ